MADEPVEQARSAQSTALYLRLRDKLLTQVEQSLALYMPAHPLRDFLSWSISAHNPQRERWLQLVGLSQPIQLTMKLLDGLVTGTDYERLLDYSLPMTVYQFYEIVSDNLCIGLGSPIPGDVTQPARRELVLAFNRAMVARLRGDVRSGGELLADGRAPARQISALKNTLSADAYTAVAAQYIEQRSGTSLSHLDDGVWPLLVANIESCHQLAQRVGGLHLGPTIVEGLVNRYQAVSALLEQPEMWLSRRVAVSTDAILVVPTLAYYIGWLKEVIAPAAAIADLAAEGLIGESLFTASLLVRLLNDLGTPLLVDAQVRAALLESLRAGSRGAAGQQPFARLLGEQLGASGAALSRLNKDMTHGELNVCLFGLLAMPAAKAVSCFAQRLEQLATLYAQSHEYLERSSHEVTARLQDDRPAELTYRFVRFHEHLYANSYTAANGEYSG